jgi:hypothetical protein
MGILMDRSAPTRLFAVDPATKCRREIDVFLFLFLIRLFFFCFYRVKRFPEKIPTQRPDNARYN